MGDLSGLFILFLLKNPVISRRKEEAEKKQAETIKEEHRKQEAMERLCSLAN